MVFYNFYFLFFQIIKKWKFTNKVYYTNPIIMFFFMILENICLMRLFGVVGWNGGFQNKKYTKKINFKRINRIQDNDEGKIIKICF